MRVWCRMWWSHVTVAMIVTWLYFLTWYVVSSRLSGDAPFHISVFPTSTLLLSWNSTLLHLSSWNSALLPYLDSAPPSSQSPTPLSILNLSEDTLSLTLTSQNSTLPLSRNSIPPHFQSLNSTPLCLLKLGSVPLSPLELPQKWNTLCMNTQGQLEVHIVQGQCAPSDGPDCSQA